MSEGHRLERQWNVIQPYLRSLVTRDDVDEVMADAAEEFAAMVDEIPYADRPHHTMALSALGCAATLAVYKAVRRRGVGVHEFGRAVHAAPLPPPDPTVDREKVLEQMRREARESQESAKPNEFVFEFVKGDDGDTDWGMNVISCAICHQFSTHDAMDLVPYMCALDDAASDAGDRGLRRSGTIALGAHRCDFRYKQGGRPQRLAAQYPERVQLADPE